MKEFHKKQRNIMTSDCRQTIVIKNNKPQYRYAEIYSTQLLQCMPRLHRQKF